MKKSILLLTSDKYPHDMSMYEVTQEEGSVKMFYARCDKQWCHPGKLAYTLEDTEDDFIFTDHVTGKKIRFDYCQAEAIRCLLKLEDTKGATFNLFDKKK